MSELEEFRTRVRDFLATHADRAGTASHDDGDAVSCEVLDRCLDVSRYLLECAGDWLG